MTSVRWVCVLIFAVFVCAEEEGCVPLSLIACHYACGVVPDGCGGHIDCEECVRGTACRNNVCNCEPETCTSAGKDCGLFATSDVIGCGTVVDCGECGPRHVCEDNVCVSAPPWRSAPSCVSRADRHLLCAGVRACRTIARA
eukprot:SAG11_NODE_894_length_6647_cov_2.924099_2_plen_142_part_00